MKSFIFLFLVVLPFGCTSNETPVIKNEPIKQKSVLTYRGTTGTSSYSMNINNASYNNVIINTSIVTPISSDKPSLYVIDGIMNTSNLSVVIPNDGRKYWWVPFDGADSPSVTSGGGSAGGVLCLCYEGGGNCGVGFNGTVYYCINTNCSGCCDVVYVAETNKGSGVIIAALTLQYNGITYQ